MISLAARLKSSIGAVGRGALGASVAIALFAGAPGAGAQEAAHAHAPAHDHAAVVPATGQGPALWVVKDADSTLYLFGTIHVLRPDTPWGSAKVDAAFDASDELILEFSNPDDQAALVPIFRQHGVSPERPLSSLLTAEELAELDTAARTIGGTAAGMDTLRPWLAAVTLAVAPLLRAGYDPQSGVERLLKARALEAHKRVGGFETADQQIRIIAGLSEETQLDLLRATLKEFHEALTGVDDLVSAWASGDEAAIDRLAVSTMREQSEEIYQALLVRRNADWADQIQALLAGSGTTFIAVGSAHLAGDDSVQSILQARGVEVERQ